MICYKCTHSIIRSLWDGVSENEVIHCEIDNVQVSRQMRRCSRADVPVVEVVYVPPPEIVEPEPIPEPVVKKKPGNPNWVKRGA